jgi:hypothetical protein
MVTDEKISDKVSCYSSGESKQHIPQQKHYVTFEVFRSTSINIFVTRLEFCN